MKALQDLTLLNKFLFDEIMAIPEAHEATLQIILQNEDLQLLIPGANRIPSLRRENRR